MMTGITTKSTISLWTKRLVIAALKGNFMIWVKTVPETLAANKIKRAFVEIEAKICLIS
jgi:hypothetical protein